MIKNITYGSDPEFFIYNRDIEKVVPSTFLVDGIKDNPYELEEGYKILRDNILVEGNVPVTTTESGFIHSIIELKSKIIKYLKNKYESLEIISSDCMELDPIYLTDPEALLFGCDPYLNAWDDDIHKANDLSSVNYRTAGFHIHIGYDRDDECSLSQLTMNKLIARAFDLFVVIPSYIEQFDIRRFGNYGGVGQYRDTSYGLECRSLGSYFSNDKYLPWVIKQTNKALDYVNKEENLFSLLYMEKPILKTNSNGEFLFDSSIYDELGISFEEQLFDIKKLEYVRNIWMDRK